MQMEQTNSEPEINNLCIAKTYIEKYTVSEHQRNKKPGSKEENEKKMTRNECPTKTLSVYL